LGFREKKKRSTLSLQMRRKSGCRGGKKEVPLHFTNVRGKAKGRGSFHPGKRDITFRKGGGSVFLLEG